MNKFARAKVGGFSANPKGLTDFFPRLLRQRGRFATKGRKWFLFLSWNNNFWAKIWMVWIN